MRRTLPDRQAGYLLTRRHLLAHSSIDPRAVYGNVIPIPDLCAYLKYVHDRGGCDETFLEKQARPGFRFDGKAFARYEEKVLRTVLGKRIERIYFPAVYSGVVASAIAAERYEVRASDLSPYWAKQARARGLTTEIRGIDDFPESSEFKMDAVVCFEPYIGMECLLHSYIALLRTLAKGIPLLHIRVDDVDYYFENRIPKNIPLVLKTRYLKETKEGYKTQRHYEQIPFTSMRMGYDYGCKGYQHLIYRDDLLNVYVGRDAVFLVSCVVPTPEVSERARIDLMLIERYKEWAKEGVSVRKLAETFNRTIEEISAALFRLIRTLEKTDLRFVYKKCTIES